MAAAAAARWRWFEGDGSRVGDGTAAGDWGGRSVVIVAGPVKEIVWRSRDNSVTGTKLAVTPRLRRIPPRLRGDVGPWEGSRREGEIRGERLTGVWGEGSGSSKWTRDVDGGRARVENQAIVKSIAPVRQGSRFFVPFERDCKLIVNRQYDLISIS